jgi:hypothetical protein
VDGFYDNQPEKTLRLGDVITGFQVATPQVHQPFAEKSEWTIAVAKPPYLVVMTPCCSIEKKGLVLAPLTPIRPVFLMNEHFAEDLTRINREVVPEKSVPIEVWEKRLPPERKEEMLAMGPSYAFRDCFVYDQHDLLRPYTLNSKPPKETSFYMVDFKCTYRIDCNLIDRDVAPPPEMKILQLSVPTRDELRRKLAMYFGRIPKEDAALL